MLQVSFDIVVDADEMDADTFMNFVDQKLYDKYHGDVSPAVRSGRQLVDGTVLADTVTSALSGVMRDLESLGLRIKSVDVWEAIEVAPSPQTTE